MLGESIGFRIIDILSGEQPGNAIYVIVMCDTVICLIVIL